MVSQSRKKVFGETAFFLAFGGELYLATRYKEIFETKNVQEQLGYSGRSLKLYSKRQFHGRSYTGRGNQNYNLIGHQIRESLVT